MRTITILAALAAALVFSPASASAQGSEAYRPQASTARVIRNLDRLSGETERERIEKAVALMTEIAENERKPAIDRSVAYELRARFQYALDGDPSAYADDMLLALEHAPEDDFRRSRLVEQIGQALIIARRLDEALVFAETHAEDFFRGASQANFYRAEIFASRGQLGQAIEALGAERQPGDSLEEQKLRYALLVTLGRYDEAQVTLSEIGEDAFFATAADEEAARLAALEARGASEAERRDLAVRFTDSLEAMRQDAEPLVRQPPSGFERCIGSYEGEIRVRMRFDVTEEGRTENVEVLQSTGRCFNRYAVEAVEKWRYEPATIDGEVVRRRGVETTIVFSIG